ncbi:uncharacterized protein GGS22DRAFT_155153 [Annulohypoxylon maeteangense]|uniref:uncharacterized protein n=1 Tax=Annulohypoxylon maeteangense TaxID=1927788 RepID=UPI0020074ADB|nr:uncharacterized protein GGS22DRAFT_155153 [Annulohypoxylon maeteangense]KAI0888136.1 hypothetical protein GGS22DRAFT_155153 [Annulohypoxylon maeteangense]
MLFTSLLKFHMCSSSQVDIMSKSENINEFHGAAPMEDDYAATHPIEYKIPGFLVNPTKLAQVLRSKFETGQYTVKLRNDNYSISAPTKLTKDELIMCH